MNEILEILRAGWPMTQDAIADAVKRPPKVVREELYRLVIRGELARRCGTGSAPAQYVIPTQQQQVSQ